MPELPEVETVVRELRETIIGQIITDVEIKRTACIFPAKKKFVSLLVGTTFTKVRRRGKNILIDVSNHHTLWVHLKMTGHFFYLPKSQQASKHDHIVWSLKNDARTLRFNDYRRFGYVKIFPSNDVMNQPGLAQLGPEPLELSADQFVDMCLSRSRMIKPALLDQTFIAGLGNIYTDESLYLSKIHPRRLTDSLSRRKLTELHGHIQDLLKKAIRLMGTSVDSFSGVNGQPGQFQSYLKAYGRQKEPCERCGALIRKETVGGRSAHYCPRCQRNR